MASLNVVYISGKWKFVTLPFNAAQLLLSFAPRYMTFCHGTEIVEVRANSGVVPLT